jgi:hypothetical protein
MQSTNNDARGARGFNTIHTLEEKRTQCIESHGYSCKSWRAAWRCALYRMIWGALHDTSQAGLQSGESREMGALSQQACSEERVAIVRCE